MRSRSCGDELARTAEPVQHGGQRLAVEVLHRDRELAWSSISLLVCTTFG